MFLSRRGYAIEKDGNETLVAELREQLTVQPKVIPGMGNAPDPFPVYRENSKKIYIPRNFGLQRFGVPAHDTLSGGVAAPGLVFQGKLRPEQEEPVSAVILAALDPLRRGGLLVVPPGFGKTSMSLYVGCHFKRRMLVVCHKSFLMEQWKERISQFIPTASVGVIQQQRVDVDGKDIVIASLQSLSMRDYPESVFSSFYCVVLDECHHLGAEVFSRALAKIAAPVMIGLSATPNRKDGLRKVFEWHLGKVIYEIKRRDDVSVLVQMVKFYDRDPEYSRERLMWNGKPNTAAMMNAVCAFPPRNVRIMEEIQKVHAQDPERRWLVMSARRGHLLELKRMIEASGLGTTGLYLGGMKQDDLNESTTKKFILATVNMCAEGFDVPALNTMVLATPMTSMEQPIGRIQRQKPHERTHTPLVIDIWDEIGVFHRQALQRISFYKKQGYAFVAGGATSSEAEKEEVPKNVDFVEDSDDGE